MPPINPKLTVIAGRDHEEATRRMVDDGLRAVESARAMIATVEHNVLTVTANLRDRLTGIERDLRELSAASQPDGSNLAAPAGSDDRGG